MWKIPRFLFDSQLRWSQLPQDGDRASGSWAQQPQLMSSCVSVCADRGGGFCPPNHSSWTSELIFIISHISCSPAERWWPRCCPPPHELIGPEQWWRAQLPGARAADWATCKQVWGASANRASSFTPSVSTAMCVTGLSVCHTGRKGELIKNHWCPLPLQTGLDLISNQTVVKLGRCENQSLCSSQHTHSHTAACAHKPKAKMVAHAVWKCVCVTDSWKTTPRSRTQTSGVGSGARCDVPVWPVKAVPVCVCVLFVSAHVQFQGVAWAHLSASRALNTHMHSKQEHTACSKPAGETVCLPARSRHARETYTSCKAGGGGGEMEVNKLTFTENVWFFSPKQKECLWEIKSCSSCASFHIPLPSTRPVTTREREKKSWLEWKLNHWKDMCCWVI